MIRSLTLCLVLGIITVGLATAGDRDAPTDAENGFVWDSAIPDDCPFERSQTITGIYFTGRHSDYHCGDTFYPSWASDGNLYSPWTDGVTDGVRCGSGGSLERGFRTGHAVMIGDDPLNLVTRAVLWFIMVSGTMAPTAWVPVQRICTAALDGTIHISGLCQAFRFPMTLARRG